jgi:hypothetical protein
MVAPTKTKNPVNADAMHILSNMTMTLLPMPSHGSNINGRSRLRLLSGSGLKYQIKSPLDLTGTCLSQFHYYNGSRFR